MYVYVFSLVNFIKKIMCQHQILSFILVEFMVFGSLLFATKVSQICSNLQQTMTFQFFIFHKSFTCMQFCRKLLQHFWLVQQVAAALLVAAALSNLVGSIIRLQRYSILSFILTGFIVLSTCYLQQMRCKYTALCSILLFGSKR